MSIERVRDLGAPESRRGIDVAIAVRHWRDAHSHSLETAGRVLGVAHTTVRDWERGRVPNPESLLRIETVLSCTTDIDDFGTAKMSVLRKTRIRRGLSMHAVARSVGVSIATLSLWERNKRTPAWHYAIRLARILEMPVSALPASPAPRRSPSEMRAAPRTVIVAMRRAAQLTRVQAAHRLGVTTTLLAHVEAGRRPVGLGLACGMARVYRRTVPDVFGACGIVPTRVMDRRSWCPELLPELLEFLRAESGRSLTSLARVLHAKPRTVARWETGECAPRFCHLLALDGLYSLGGDLARLAREPPQRSRGQPRGVSTLPPAAAR